jgi:hypothetical protein
MLNLEHEQHAINRAHKPLTVAPEEQILRSANQKVLEKRLNPL